ncbi:unnamed protein product [Ambrosiozyma monospora]|uniref:Unnamed protein product n=1 Tax=Ambrosiozyma monospora TaxID=43982 RepID=A0A9W6Z4A1_AMBMO|nr:unnamed protein product [Ambrosiozyma monospora]
MNEEVTLFMNRVLTDTLEETAMDNDNVNYFWSIINGNDPLGFGRKNQFINMLIENFEVGLTTVPIKLTCRSLINLYNIFSDKFTMFPRFIKKLIQFLDTQKNSQAEHTVLNLEAAQLLLKFVKLNEPLLISCGNAESNVMTEISIVITSWINNGKFHMLKAASIISIPSLILNITQDAPKTQDNVDCSGLTLQDINTIGINSFERLLNAAEFSHHVSQSLSQYSNVVKGFNTGLEPTVTGVLSVLKDWKPIDFENIVTLNIKKFVLPTLSLDYEMSLKFILKLIVDNFISLQTVMSLFRNSQSSNKDEFSTWSITRLVCDILFGNSFKFRLSEMEQFSLKYERRIFKYSHPREYYYIVSLVSQKTQVSVVKEPSNNHTVGVDMVGVVDDVVSVDVMNSLHDLGNVSTGVGVGVGVVVGAENERDGDVNESGVGRPKIKGEWKSSPELVDSVWNMVASQPELFEEFYHSRDNKYTCELNDFFNSLLNIEQDNFDAPGNTVSTGVSTPAPIVGSLVKRLTYFNLPICQWLFKHTIEENVPSMEDEFDTRNKKVTEVVIELLDHLSERQRQDQLCESYLIGELFDQLSNAHKLVFLNACEGLYLGSEKFPKFITNGKNLTKFLISMISSCSRLKDYNSGVMPMSDALVFSLNMSLEKLMYFCSNVEREKNKRDSMRTIETAIILLSRIILIHKSFLVELILERSVNIQRDVLILNLTNCKFPKR